MKKRQKEIKAADAEVQKKVTGKCCFDRAVNKFPQLTSYQRPCFPFGHHIMIIMVIAHHRYGVRGQNSRLDVTRVLTLRCSGMGHLNLGTGQIEHCQGDSDSFGALLDKTLPNTERYSQSCCDVTTVVVIFFPMVIKYLKIFG